MFVVIPLLWSTLLLAAATSDAQESRVQVLLQGQDAEALREALSSVQGRLTHTLPLVNGIGGEIAADMLEPLRASTAVQRLVEDFNPTQPPEQRECAIAGDVQASFTTQSLSWRIHNFTDSTVTLNSFLGSWPLDWGRARATLGSAASSGGTAILGAAVTSESLITDAVLPPGLSTLTLAFDNSLNSPTQNQIDLVVKTSLCDVTLLPAYEHNGSDFYYTRYVGADLLHRSGITGAGIGVAIIDSGLWDHPALTRGTDGNLRVPAQYNAINPDEPGPLEDKGGHGSHMASIIANSEPVTRVGGSGFKGIAPDVQLIPVTAVTPQGDGDFLDIIRGIQWVIDHAKPLNIRVLNLSLTATPRFAYWDDPMNQAVLKAWQAGITVVVAAGNDGPDWQTIGSPGNNPYVITVGALTDSWTPEDRRDDYIPNFSSRGPTPMGHIKPDLLAPGGHMTGLIPPDSTLARENPNYLLAGGEFVSTGSSQSAAVVSGIAALLLSAKPDLSNDEIKCLMLTSAEPAIARDGRLAYSPFLQGAGSVNAARALTLGETQCDGVGQDIRAAARGEEQLEGPAIRNVAGDPMLPNLSSMLSPLEAASGFSEDRRWGVKAHLERLDPAKDSPQADGVPFDWAAVYEAEAQKIRALSPENAQ